jgi:hypothetical protein
MLLPVIFLLLVAYVAACDIPVAYAAAAVDPAITDNSGMDPRSRIYINNTLRIRNTESYNRRLSEMLLEMPRSA